MPSVQTPYILLIDLDGTIQGDITPQLKEYNLIKSLKLNISAKKSHKNDYIKGLMRPHFADFIKLIKRKYLNNVELFIYTASHKTWAHYIVPIIESIIGFKFNRPIFTREHCFIKSYDDKAKNIDYVKYHVIKSLRSKHGKIIDEHTLNDKIFVFRSVFYGKMPSY